MRRRELVLGFIGAAALSSPCARAQPKIPTVGILLVQSPGSKEFVLGLPQAMHNLGYAPGQNIRFEVRSDDGQQTRLPALAADLVRLNVDVIVTWFTPAAHAAKGATSDIPIVMSSGAAVETGLVASLARPGGNVTGISDMGPELDGKLVELIRELIPSADHIAAMANVSDPFSKPFLEKIEEAGQATHTTIDPIRINGPAELDAGFAALKKTQPYAVIVQPSLGLDRPAALAAQYRIPSCEHFREFAEAGGLMSYSPLRDDLYRRAAVFVDKILKGAKPADLPVERPTKFELVVNLKTAKTIGIAVPATLLERADYVIE